MNVCERERERVLNVFAYDIELAALIDCFCKTKASHLLKGYNSKD